MGLFQFILTLLEFIWILSPVWCHPLLSASITLISFQPLISVLKNTCAAPIFLVLCSSPSQFCCSGDLQHHVGIQTQLSCTSSPTRPGALETLLGQSCSSTWAFHCPLPSPQLFLSPKAVSGPLCPFVPSCDATLTPVFRHPTAWLHEANVTRVYVHFTWLYPGKSREMFFKTRPNTSPWAYSWLKSVAMRLKWC